LCLYAGGAYGGILSSWSRRDCEEIDSLFSAEICRRSKNLRISQTDNLYQPVLEGGLRHQRFSSMVQQRKKNCIHRLLAHGDPWTQLVVQGLRARGHHSPSHSPMYALSPQCVRPGYWISSLLSYGFQGHACPARPLRSKFRHTPPQPSDSIVGNLAHSRCCNKAQHAYLRAHHLLTYADLVAWSGNSWRWRFLTYQPTSPQHAAPSHSRSLNPSPYSQANHGTSKALPSCFPTGSRRFSPSTPTAPLVGFDRT